MEKRKENRAEIWLLIHCSELFPLFLVDGFKA